MEKPNLIAQAEKALEEAQTRTVHAGGASTATQPLPGKDKLVLYQQSIAVKRSKARLDASA